MIISLFLIPSVIAQNNIVRSFDFNLAKYWINRVIHAILGFLSPVFELIIGDYNTSEFFFSKILLFILLFIIIKNVLDRTPIGEHNERIGFIISLIVSILSIRFINQNNFFESIFVQYGTLGIAITTVFPMVIFFWFIHNTNIGSFGRRIAWIIYTTSLTLIWFSKAQIPATADWIYLITISATIVFVLFDKKIHSYFGINHFKSIFKTNNENLILDEMEKLEKLERYGKGLPNYKRRKKEIKKRIEDLSREE